MNELNSAVSVAEWISSQLNDLIDKRQDYGTAYHLEELLEELLETVSKKFKIPENSFKIENDDDIQTNQYGEQTIRGKIKLNGVGIINYSSYGDGWGFGADVKEDMIKFVLEKFLKPTLEARINNMIPFKTWLENKLLSETYQPEVTGILKVKPEPSELLNLQQKVLEKFPDLKPLSPDKLHVTMLHQKFAKPLAKLTLPPLAANLTFDPKQVYLIEREGKKSVFVVVNEQEALKQYMAHLGPSLGIELITEPGRVFHVTLANLTGNPADSVGHSEDNHITNGAVKVLV